VCKKLGTKKDVQRPEKERSGFYKETCMETRKEALEIRKRKFWCLEKKPGKEALKTRKKRKLWCLERNQQPGRGALKSRKKNAMASRK
jgi:hypothetical protein